MKLIEIGKILKPQGIKGEIKVEPLTKNTEQFLTLKEVFVSGKEYKIVKSAVRQGYIYLFFEGINRCEDVEPLRGKYISRDREELPVDEDEYLIVDLMGCTIVDENGIVYGEITDIDDYGAASVITILGKRGQFSFPYVDDIFTEIDIENKRIVINSQRYKEVVVI